MGRKWSFIIILLLSTVISLYGKKKPAEDPPKYLIHVVKAKETLYSISKQYGVSVTDILNVNPSLGETNKLSLEQMLRIPNKFKKKQLTTTLPSNNELQPKVINQPQELPANGTYHTVVKGQTLYSISKMYNVSLQDLQKWNHLPDFNVKLGSQLIVANPSGRTILKNETGSTPLQKQEIPVNKEESVTVPLDTESINDEIERPDIQASDNISQKEMGKIFRQKAASASMQTIKGTGAPMTTTLGSMETTYFAMHKTLSIGTIIKIKNLVNSKIVYAKVIGKLPENDENKHVIVRYTLGVKKDLQLQNGKCYVQIEYPN
ncbi:MAG: peptidoglycan-binding protein [Bacteroidota bacterium]|nr:peptidoglycan-binding protein [Bacteroidota bacterium]